MTQKVSELLKELEQFHLQNKRNVAREIWKIKNEQTPSGKMTWGAWFKEKYDQTLEEFAEEVHKEELLKKFDNEYVPGQDG